MNKTTILMVIIAIVIAGCKEEKHKFPLDKKFWTPADYDEVNLDLNYGYEPDEKLPSLDDPETRAVVEKLTDQQNYLVVLDDNELGLKHRNNVAEQFFLQWKDMNKIYRGRDVQDNYIYDRELIKTYHFGLGLQLKYFKLGNDEILASADDPEDPAVVRRVNSNIQTMIGNFNIYLDEINDEDSYSEEGLKLLAEGIDKYFIQLVDSYPDANYNGMQKKVQLLKNKSKSDAIKNSLESLDQLIESKKVKSAALLVK